MASKQPHNTKLMKMVFIITRHGRRTPCFPESFFYMKYQPFQLEHPPNTYIPVECVCNEAKKNRAISVNEEGILGQLTKQGAEDQFELGETLRQRYIIEKKLLTDEFDKNDVMVRSSRRKRTFESARCVLAGMYPNYNDNKKISINLDESKYKDILCPPNPYPIMVSEELKKNPLLLPGLSEAIRKVKEQLPVKEDFDLFQLYDNIETLKASDMCFPISKEMESTISKYGYDWFERTTIGTERNRFNVVQAAIGLLVNFILNNVENLLHQKLAQKFFLLSGHDYTLYCILNAVGFEFTGVPPTSSFMSIEIYEDSQNGEWSANCAYNMVKDQAQTFMLEHFVKVLGKFRLTPETYKKKFL
ncbi:lysophosphatidic acid phosphatase type 6-like [Clavelina lepadiformis]|uniref:lysophosphatidic acid phosphatase type 6-like n=1 Tax=Clavelina lepadiformis TaxID=159417 RepID=UPI0040432204